MKETETLLKVLQECGEILSSKFNKTSYKLKGRANLVTEADIASQQKAIGIISKCFPNDSIIAEENFSGTVPSGRAWIIDPLDGTTNYAHGFPIAGISVAFAKEGKTLSAGVFNPMGNELFSAEKGKGAFLNNEKIHVSKTQSVENALLVTGFPYDRAEKADYYLKFFKEFMKKSHDVRRLGAASLDMCWLAAGRTDGYWEFNLKPWDVAAGWLIAEEAGGKISDFSGTPWKIDDSIGQQTLATNGLIHEEMLEIIKQLI
ncbi:MAG: inositol monophosphatase [Elusimicrobiales bacterium]|nr:inositol monophosphatase [Elusimicrobiales bacterium]